MRVVKIVKEKGKKDRLDTMAQCSWSILKKCPVEGEDLRFTLYGNLGENNCVMIDIDKCALIHHSKVTRAAKKVILFKHHVVFTGRGFHVYVPVKNHFPPDQYKHYRQSYNELTERFRDELGLPTVKFDRGVFNTDKLGRVPGSKNSKGSHCRFIATNGAERCSHIKSFLDYEEVPESDLPPVTYRVDKTTPKDHVIYRECKFLQWCRKQEHLAHKLWFKALCIAKNAGNIDLAYYVSEGDESNMDKVEESFNHDKKYFVGCGGVDSACKEDGHPSPCEGCVHKNYSSTPNSITGRYPTPSFSRHFKKQVMVPGTSKAPVFKADPKKLEIEELYNYYVNKNYDEIIELEGQNRLFRYDGVQWKDLTGLKEINTRVYQEISEMAPGGTIMDLSDAERLHRCFKTMRLFRPIPPDDCSKEGFINFQNGALNTTTGEFLSDTKEMYFLNSVSTSYDKDADCPTFRAMMKKHVPDEMNRRIIKVFMGLTISNIPVHSYESFLWLKGEPGSVKTTFLEVFKILTEGSNVPLKGNPKFVSDNTVEFDFSQSSLMWIDDFKLGGSNPANWEAMINKFSSGQSIFIKKLYYDSFQCKPKCTLIATSNQYPPFTGEDQGLYRRLRLVPLYTLVKDKDKDRDIRDKLEEELPGIVNYALEGLRDFDENGMPPESDGELSEKDMLKSQEFDYIKEFIKNHLEMCDPGEGESKPYKLYNSFCKLYGLDERSFPKNDFTHRLKSRLSAEFNICPSKLTIKSSGRTLFGTVRFKETKNVD